MTRPGPRRETFATRFGALATMVGVAAGLGNVWRFPYMVGRFGGAAFVLFYLLAVLFIGVPALVAEWTLGRHTRKGTVGAFELAGLPFGRWVGRSLFLVMTAAVGYYTNVIGWVAYYAIGQAAAGIGMHIEASAILPPTSGTDGRSFLLQALLTGLVIAGCALVLSRGLRAGIERVSRRVTPALFVILLILIARSLTLPGATEGLSWYILKFDPGSLRPGVLVAALGQAIFSLSLGGTFMVVYGSYLDREERLLSTAAWTAGGDTTVGLLAGLAIFPAVFALGLEPAGGPGLIFSTLPGVFGELPVGWLFGLLFFGALLGAAYLSDIAGFEVLVAGLTDNTRLRRATAVWLMAGVTYLFALIPMINMRVFVPWDLTFGSGAQTVGALLAVVTVAWCLDRSAALGELAAGGGSRLLRPLYLWIRYVVPSAILMVGVWWLLTDVLGVFGGA